MKISITSKPGQSRAWAGQLTPSNQCFGNSKYYKSMLKIPGQQQLQKTQMFISLNGKIIAIQINYFAL